jgi:hypothetical protein
MQCRMARYSFDPVQAAMRSFPLLGSHHGTDISRLSAHMWQAN